MPSDPNYKSKLPESFVFFVERSLGRKKVAEALRQAGIAVEIHEDHFPSDAKDEVWLTEVGSRGWVVLTKDRHIRYREPEINAILKAHVAAFVLTGGNLTGDEMAAVFVKALPQIRKLLSKHARPFIARVTKGGAVSLLSTKRTTK